MSARSGFVDLVLASNGDDTVAVYYNQQGTGTFKRHVVYDNADFVLSCAAPLTPSVSIFVLTECLIRRVTAADFDRDGDIDLASASYFDGAIRWYENTDGAGTAWKVFHPCSTVAAARITNELPFACCRRTCCMSARSAKVTTCTQLTWTQASSSASHVHLRVLLQTLSTRLTHRGMPAPQTATMILLL